VALYQHAARRLLEAKDRVRQMAHQVTGAAALLEGDRWKAVAQGQVTSGSPVAESAADARADLDHLPSGTDLVAALAGWREACDTLAKAWQALPADCRVGLKEPEELY
jgi:hypothetical protein